VIDIAEASYGLNTTGSVTMLNGVATGTDFTDRIGRSITMKSVLIQGYTETEDTDVAATLCRVMIILDKQPNAALPTIANIFNAATSSAPLNLTNRDRFRVIMEKMFVCGYYNKTATFSLGDQTSKLVKKYIKMNIPVTYNGTGATIAAIQSNSLLLVTLGNQAAGAGYTFKGSVRVRFVDA